MRSLVGSGSLVGSRLLVGSGLSMSLCDLRNRLRNNTFLDNSFHYVFCNLSGERLTC